MPSQSKLFYHTLICPSSNSTILSKRNDFIAPCRQKINVKYSVIIAYCIQKNGFFDHLHSSEISEKYLGKYLIFFVLVWHLIISNNIWIKIISTCQHNNLNRVEWGSSDYGAIPIIFFSLWEKLHNYPENSLFKEV